MKQKLDKHMSKFEIETSFIFIKKNKFSCWPSGECDMTSSLFCVHPCIALTYSREFLATLDRTSDISSPVDEEKQDDDWEKLNNCKLDEHRLYGQII